MLLPRHEAIENLEKLKRDGRVDFPHASVERRGEFLLPRSLATMLPAYGFFQSFFRTVVSTSRIGGRT